ncbi:hypothetical protein NM208_g566 [Fusarium decemcellulare]|uniref:Uncharacterized protein n=2 Tax=Fusarium decemcellulare TaxID=57161 RepID=A0ACC1SYS2_9HYPO|nr:hypothetical protein NM208_g747 [Fusarium decemcellulare]KAJ3549309.1 hypothetical protein NM208_g566 [Fusarium decemcellulare]
MSAWRDENSLTTVDALLQEVPGRPTKYHDPKLRHVEEELLQHYRDYCHFCNKVCVNDPDAGKKLWHLDDMILFDLMGQVKRSDFGAHYDKITPYLADAQITIKELEVVAVTETFGYATNVQRYWGTATDGNPFDLHFRATSLIKKEDGQWRMIHEHLSFPCDMSTKIADFTSGLAIEESLALKK